MNLKIFKSFRIFCIPYTESLVLDFSCLLLLDLLLGFLFLQQLLLLLQHHHDLCHLVGGDIDVLLIDQLYHLPHKHTGQINVSIKIKGWQELNRKRKSMRDQRSPNLLPLRRHQCLSSHLCFRRVRLRCWAACVQGCSGSASWLQWARWCLSDSPCKTGTDYIQGMVDGRVSSQINQSHAKTAVQGSQKSRSWVKESVMRKWFTNL